MWAKMHAYVWLETEKNYAPTGGDIPLIVGEFVDVVLIESDDSVMIFLARQFDDQLGVITDQKKFDLFDKNNPANIWLEEY